MNIMLVERVVERCHDPSNPNYLKVENMSTKIVGDYVSNIIPRQGEIIFIDDDKIYDVVQVIYQRHGPTSHGATDFSVHIEVKPHLPVHAYQTSGFSFKEDWPTIVSLPADLSYFQKCEEDDDNEEHDDDPYSV